MDVPGFALITGAASGIGRACAKAFALEGSAGVALLDINEEALGKVKAEIEEESRARQGSTACEVLVRPLDVAQEDQVTQTVHEVAKTFGRLDYVVNAAGIALRHENGTAFASTEDWNRVLNINLSGTFFVVRAAAQIMLRQEPILSAIDNRPLQRGSIVNLGSILGLVGTDASVAYTAAKHAVVGLTRSVSEDHAKDGLRVNAVCPGFTETPMTTRDPEIQKFMESVVDPMIPMRRVGQPTEIANGVLYLAGGRSSYVTGSAMVIDGGYTSR
ncbi:hypothetical protein CDD83_8529 [Cordyceps sp. RAO-2017]|nr:hypothetical protein CDD83_8529 [Cordyceps sp. RAO-2017]